MNTASRGQNAEAWIGIARGTETVLRGLDVIMHIRRVRRSFRGAHCGSAPLPRLTNPFNCFIILDQTSLILYTYLFRFI